MHDRFIRTLKIHNLTGCIASCMQIIGIRYKKSEWNEHFRHECLYSRSTHPSNSLNIHNWNFSITYFSSILLLLFDGRKRCFYLPQNRNCNPLKFCCGNGLLSQTCQKDVCFQIICLFHLAKNQTKTTRKRKGWRKNVRVGSTVLNTRLWRANMTFKIHICQK